MNDIYILRCRNKVIGLVFKEGLSDFLSFELEDGDYTFQEADINVPLRELLENLDK